MASSKESLNTNTPLTLPHFTHTHTHTRTHHTHTHTHTYLPTYIPTYLPTYQIQLTKVHVKRARVKRLVDDYITIYKSCEQL